MKMKKLGEEHTSRFLSLKRKIISTDLLISKYKEQAIELTSCRSKLDAAVNKIKSKDRELAIVENSLQAAKTKLEQVLESNGALERRCTEYETTLSTNNDKIVALQGINQQLTLSHKEHDKELETQKSELAAAKAELRELNKVGPYKKRHEHAAEQNERLKAEATELRRELKNQRHQHEAEIRQLKRSQGMALHPLPTASSKARQNSKAHIQNPAQPALTSESIFSSEMSEMLSRMPDSEGVISSDSEFETVNDRHPVIPFRTPPVPEANKKTVNHNHAQPEDVNSARKSSRRAARKKTELISQSSDRTLHGKSAASMAVTESQQSREMLDRPEALVNRRGRTVRLSDMGVSRRQKSDNPDMSTSNNKLTGVRHPLVDNIGEKTETTKQIANSNGKKTETTKQIASSNTKTTENTKQIINSNSGKTTTLRQGHGTKCIKTPNLRLSSDDDSTRTVHKQELLGSASRDGESLLLSSGADSWQGMVTKSDLNSSRQFPGGRRKRTLTEDSSSSMASDCERGVCGGDFLSDEDVEAVLSKMTNSNLISPLRNATTRWHSGLNPMSKACESVEEPGKPSAGKRRLPSFSQNFQVNETNKHTPSHPSIARISLDADEKDIPDNQQLADSIHQKTLDRELNASELIGDISSSSDEEEDDTKHVSMADRSQATEIKLRENDQHIQSAHSTKVIQQAMKLVDKTAETSGAASAKSTEVREDSVKPGEKLQNAGKPVKVIKKVVRRAAPILPDIDLMSRKYPMRDSRANSEDKDVSIDDKETIACAPDEVVSDSVSACNNTGRRRIARVASCNTDKMEVSQASQQNIDVSNTVTHEREHVVESQTEPPLTTEDPVVLDMEGPTVANQKPAPIPEKPTPTTGVSSSITEKSSPTAEKSVLTTEVSASATEEPVPTTEESASNTEEMAPITEKSAATTEVSAPTTEEPVPTIEESVVNTEETAPITEKSAATTEVSASATEEPTPTTEESVSNTEETAPITKKSAATTDVSAPATEEPVPTIKESAANIEETAPITEKSSATAEVSASATEESAPTTEKLASTIEVSVPITGKSVPSTEESALTAEKLTPVIEKSAPTTEESTLTTQMSAPITEVPASPTEKSASTAEELAPTTEEPASTTKELTPALMNSTLTVLTNINTPSLLCIKSIDPRHPNKGLDDKIKSLIKPAQEESRMTSSTVKDSAECALMPTHVTGGNNSCSSVDATGSPFTSEDVPSKGDSPGTQPLADCNVTSAEPAAVLANSGSGMTPDYGYTAELSSDRCQVRSVNVKSLATISSDIPPTLGNSLKYSSNLCNGDILSIVNVSSTAAITSNYISLPSTLKDSYRPIEVSVCDEKFTTKDLTTLLPSSTGTENSRLNNVSALGDSISGALGTSQPVKLIEEVSSVSPEKGKNNSLQPASDLTLSVASGLSLPPNPLTRTNHAGIEPKELKLTARKPMITYSRRKKAQLDKSVEDRLERSKKGAVVETQADQGWEAALRRQPKPTATRSDLLEVSKPSTGGQEAGQMEVPLKAGTKPRCTQVDGDIYSNRLGSKAVGVEEMLSSRRQMRNRVDAYDGTNNAGNPSSPEITEITNNTDDLDSPGIKGRQSLQSETASRVRKSLRIRRKAEDAPQQSAREKIKNEVQDKPGNAKAPNRRSISDKETVTPRVAETRSLGKRKSDTEATEASVGGRRRSMSKAGAQEVNVGQLEAKAEGQRAEPRFSTATPVRKSARQMKKKKSVEPGTEQTTLTSDNTSVKIKNQVKRIKDEEFHGNHSETEQNTSATKDRKNVKSVDCEGDHPILSPRSSKRLQAKISNKILIKTPEIRTGIPQPTANSPTQQSEHNETVRGNGEAIKSTSTKTLCASSTDLDRSLREVPISDEVGSVEITNNSVSKVISYADTNISPACEPKYKSKVIGRAASAELKNGDDPPVVGAGHAHSTYLAGKVEDMPSCPASPGAPASPDAPSSPLLSPSCTDPDSPDALVIHEEPTIIPTSPDKCLSAEYDSSGVGRGHGMLHIWPITDETQTDEPCCLPTIGNPSSSIGLCDHTISHFSRGSTDRPASASLLHLQNHYLLSAAPSAKAGVPAAASSYSLSADTSITDSNQDSQTRNWITSTLQEEASAGKDSVTVSFGSTSAMQRSQEPCNTLSHISLPSDDISSTSTACDDSAAAGLICSTSEDSIQTEPAKTLQPPDTATGKTSATKASSEDGVNRRSGLAKKRSESQTDNIAPKRTVKTRQRQEPIRDSSMGIAVKDEKSGVTSDATDNPSAVEFSIKNLPTETGPVKSNISGSQVDICGSQVPGTENGSGEGVAHTKILNSNTDLMDWMFSTLELSPLFPNMSDKSIIQCGLIKEGIKRSKTVDGGKIAAASGKKSASERHVQISQMPLDMIKLTSPPKLPSGLTHHKAASIKAKELASRTMFVSSTSNRKKKKKKSKNKPQAAVYNPSSNIAPDPSNCPSQPKKQKTFGLAVNPMYQDGFWDPDATVDPLRSHQNRCMPSQTGMPTLQTSQGDGRMLLSYDDDCLFDDKPAAGLSKKERRAKERLLKWSKSAISNSTAITPTASYNSSMADAGSVKVSNTDEPPS